MKPHKNKQWITIDDNQIKFLKFIQNQFKTGKYKEWMDPTIPATDFRIDVVKNSIENGGYYRKTTAHRTLKNIRNEYNKFITNKYREQTKNTWDDLFNNPIMIKVNSMTPNVK